MAFQLLSGLNVLDLTHYIAGPYCTRLLAGLGANVIKVERPGEGDPARQWPPFAEDVPGRERSGVFLWLNMGKQSITLDLKSAAGVEAFRQLVEAADVLVENFAPRVMPSLRLSYAHLRAINPRLVMTSISNFGQSGPYRDHRAEDIVLFGMGGSMASRQSLDQEPLTMAGTPAQTMAGTAGFTATLGALHGARQTGRGQHVDVSIFEAMAAAQTEELVACAYLGRDQPSPVLGLIYPCRDGHVMVVDQQPRQWRKITELIDHPDLASDPNFKTMPLRRANRELLDTYLGTWMQAQRKEDVYHAGQAAGIPSAFIATVADLVASPQIRSRGFIVEADHSEVGRLSYPGLPFHVNGATAKLLAAPRLGEHQGVTWPSVDTSASQPARVSSTSSGGGSPLPLHGIRVLDMGMFWAGPYAGRLLADMGAEVIKVEGPGRPDPVRLVPRGLFPDGERGEQPWNRSGMLNERNRNKLGISLDLLHPQGKALFKDLVAISDVVLENFSARVMGKLDLDYEALKMVNPNLVMISIASQGLTGPERHYVSVDPILQALSGVASLTGRPGEAPALVSMYADPLGAVHAAGCVVAGLLSRRQTGKGVHIDFSQREALTAAIGPALMDYTMNGRVATVQGNADGAMVLQGTYPCQGELGWITLAIRTEGEWQRLCGVLGAPAWANEPRFADPAQRQTHLSEIHAHIASWTRTQTKFDATQRLQSVGLAAGPVLSAKELFRDPHLQARGFFEVCTHPQAGTHAYCGRPMRFSETPMGTQRPAPCFGQHNAYVFGELLGLSDDALAQLLADGILSDRPLVPMGE